MKVVMEDSLGDSIDNVWATIRDFGGLGRYFSPVVKCRVEGTGIGSRRIVTLRTPTGTEVIVVEKLEELDEAAKRLVYSIPDATGFPMKDGYVGIMQLKHLDGGRCELEWTALIEPPEGVEAEVTRQFVTGVYATGFAGLKGLHSN
jgi:Polyketide cyclase / dehydrase and lipid transport